MKLQNVGRWKVAIAQLELIFYQLRLSCVPVIQLVSVHVGDSVLLRRNFVLASYFSKFYKLACITVLFCMYIYCLIHTDRIDWFSDFAHESQFRVRRCRANLFSLKRSTSCEFSLVALIRFIPVRQKTLILRLERLIRVMIRIDENRFSEFHLKNKSYAGRFCKLQCIE